MRNAQNAILSGCSAGGLTAILQCDRFRSLILAGAKAKCISDACYFINVKDVSGAQHIQEFYSQVVVTHVFFLICFRLQGKRNNKVRSCQRSLLRYTNLKGTIY
ncbi:pectin acetylesterase 11-like isoform X1 [Arachis hypogaea]|uniref:pectin acetylesterase 11-like isoform X1 n=1 Tax=Arachis hypogaea TaxID=3818 RepID=UPI003B2165BF